MIIIKESRVASICETDSYLQDASIMFYNNYESGLIDSYSTAINIEFNITDNISPITKSETSKLIINQLYISENSYLEDENDCYVCI